MMTNDERLRLNKEGSEMFPGAMTKEEHLATGYSSASQMPPELRERYLRAPAGKYRVIGVDTFSNEDGIDGDFDTEQIAKNYANKTYFGRQMGKAHIYDDMGNHLYQVGNF